MYLSAIVSIKMFLISDPHRFRNGRYLSKYLQSTKERDTMDFGVEIDSFHRHYKKVVEVINKPFFFLDLYWSV